MDNTMKRQTERFARSEAFVSANVADFPATSKGGKAAAEIRTALAEIESLEAARVTNTNLLQQAMAGKKDMRESIRAQLRAISNTAKTIALDHPEVKGGFQFKGNNMSDGALLATARAFLSATEPTKALFIEYDMPADFRDTLSANITSFEQHSDKQTAGKGERVAASTSVEDSFRRAKLAFNRLDTAISNKYRNDPAKLAAWENIRRLERAPKARNNRKKAKTDGTPPNTDGNSSTK